MGDLPSNRPVPAATGTLARTPLVHLLLYALDKKLAGTIEFTAPDQSRSSVVFVGGRPAKVRTSDEPGLYLGQSLIELGYLTGSQRERSITELAQARTAGPMLYGQHLVHSGLIDEQQLAAALRDQLERKLGLIAGLPQETAYEYLASYDTLQGWGLEVSHGQDPVPMIWRILRQIPPQGHMDLALERIAGSPLRLARNAQLQRLSLDRDESAAVELLRVRSQRVDELAVTSGLGTVQTRLLVYLLLVTKQVDVLRAAPGAEGGPAGSTPVPSGSIRDSGSSFAPPPARSPVPPSPSMPPQRTVSSTTMPQQRTISSSGIPQSHPSSASGPQYRPTPTGTRAATSAYTLPPVTPQPPKPSIPPEASRSIPPSPPRTLSTELTDRWNEIVERAHSIDRADYFTMLEVPRDATRSDIESSFYTLAKRWHPDRLPGELTPVRPACSRVFARMSEAHAALVDDESRARYMKLLADGSGSPEMQETLARVVEAATNFQKAEVCLRRNDLAQAETLCRRAVDLDATQPDYQAMLAWLFALKPENQSADKTKAAIQMLERAIAMSERCEKAFFYRAMLYKRLGRADAAVRDFKRVVNLNPRNIDAAREVRLYRMRAGGRRTSNPPATTGGAGSDPPRPEDGKTGLFGRLFKK
jgi:hypothetical protein